MVRGGLSGGGGNRKLPNKGNLTSSSSKQTTILDHFKFSSKPTQKRASNAPPPLEELPDASIQGLEEVPHDPGKYREEDSFSRILESKPIRFVDEEDIAKGDWEGMADKLLQERFGYPCLKSFQKEALAAWLAHEDCLVLAATGSGKSLCFQIPALLTGKVVVVISPLISLMHDQCLKLSKHGVSACFLGSGQPDSSVEKKAMRGMYDIIYVCPETVLRLIKQLQELAESRGITLFAIDEVHCVSKWGHDFRPDYRRLSVLRESFRACKLSFLKFDIPLMALTATATTLVREDVLKVLGMSKETKIVLTSFFRSNLRFLVKHSRTGSSKSYGKDFGQLIEIYTRKKKPNGKVCSLSFEEYKDQSGEASDDGLPEEDWDSSSDMKDVEDDCSDMVEDNTISSAEKEMSIEYLENDVDVFQSVNDWDDACGEFCGQSSTTWDVSESCRKTDPPNTMEERLMLLQEPLEDGPTIIYVPTRKETLSIAKYLCGVGVKAAAYNASLPKSHLRQVHKEFHQNMLQVVVATIAFGMGIDKSNIRRIIHYGWPQSLEAYYQEAGRAGRDGKLAECILYANMSRMPSLLPSKRSEEQTKQAYKMLSDCFRYGMNTSCCRAKILVEYFGEDFSNKKCLLCDVCVNGPPEIQNLKEEADILMQVIAAHHECWSSLDGSYDGIYTDIKRQKLMKPNLRMFVSKIREQSQKFCTIDQLCWQGLARIMESKGYIREGDDRNHVQIKFPEPTKLGLDFLQFDREQPFYIIPEADMLLSMNKCKSYATFADWGKGWADPEIRRKRLRRSQSNRKPRKPRNRQKGKFGKVKPDSKTARGRIAAKIFKK
ncbi:hypothetical protein Tsubulata_036617 [Turnera subulata]|uniref:ATP-dependent DNA helicase n=1 Tax=Turnera subulata TaxID=218843 RepID=A0A9Q0JFU6_9ROSI|nr:hypothetical protein Tsubulata_036617 [Turnera subulata]